jgi:D-alanyl-D-alanine carboxypeptidase (penicillin-binding protein 5/6)
MLKKLSFLTVALRLAAAFFTAALFAALLSVGVSALDDPGVSRCRAALVYNIDNEKLLFSTGGGVPLAPASTVKLMTAVIALDYYTEGDALDRQITITSEMLKNVTGNNIGLRTGEIVTARQLITALIVGGSNDAAYALAIDSYGSVENFVDAMNQRAEKLGMTGTYYTNPTGIDSEAMRTTLEDTLTVALEAYRHNTFMELAGISRYAMEPTNRTGTRYIHNRNYMISTAVTTDYYDKSVTGMSSGMTVAGGWCLVATSRKDGVTQLVIVMGGDREENADGTSGPIYSYVNARLLFDWAFEGYDYIRVLENTRMICEIPVTLGRGVDHVTLLPEQSLDLYLPTDIDVERDIVLSWALDKPSLVAPVKEGEVAGLLTLYYKDEIIGRVNLVVKNNVELYRILEILYKLRSVVESDYFRYAIVAAAVIGVLYVIIIAIVRGRRQRRRSYRR